MEKLTNTSYVLAVYLRRIDLGLFEVRMPGDSIQYWRAAYAAATIACGADARAASAESRGA
jgi:hypothetical protein